MQAKKKLILKLARGAAVVLVVAGLAAIGAALVDHRERQSFDQEQQRARKARIDGSRDYLAELAKRIDKLPADPTVVGEIEARYFEEQANGPFYVWATDTSGEFAFGVPRSDFAKLNAIYDREVVPRLKEGVFLDRQSFLLSLADNADDIAADPEAESVASQLFDPDRRFRRRRWEPEHSFVLSAPLQAKDGAPLGGLYLKGTPAERSEYRTDDRQMAAIAAPAALAAASFVLLWVLLPAWIYVDARDRGMRRAPLFAFLTVISSLVGLVVYLIARPEDPRRLSCPGCAREVNGGAFCPHCGRDLSSAYCPACRYPLKPEWAFCPACRTEIKPQAAGTPVAEAG